MSISTTSHTKWGHSMFLRIRMYYMWHMYTHVLFMYELLSKRFVITKAEPNDKQHLHSSTTWCSCGENWGLRGAFSFLYTSLFVRVFDSNFEIKFSSFSSTSRRRSNGRLKPFARIGSIWACSTWIRWNEKEAKREKQVRRAHERNEAQAGRQVDATSRVRVLYFTFTFVAECWLTEQREN